MASARVRQSLSKRRCLAEPLATADDTAMAGTRLDKSAHVEVGRDRVRQACYRCRLKKLKCDGIVPCGRCIKDNMICQQRERRGTNIEQTHAEYVNELEDQQHVLATALKLTWSQLHPEDCDPMPSAHSIIARLRLLPREPEASLSAGSKPISPADNGFDHKAEQLFQQSSPPFISRQHSATSSLSTASMPATGMHAKESVRSRVASTPGLFYSPDAASHKTHGHPPDVPLSDSIQEEGLFEGLSLYSIESFAAGATGWRDLDMEKTGNANGLLPDQRIRQHDELQQGNQMAGTVQPLDYDTVEPWQLMNQDQWQSDFGMMEP